VHASTAVSLRCTTASPNSKHLWKESVHVRSSAFYSKHAMHCALRHYGLIKFALYTRNIPVTTADQRGVTQLGPDGTHISAFGL